MRACDIAQAVVLDRGSNTLVRFWLTFAERWDMRHRSAAPSVVSGRCDRALVRAGAVGTIVLQECRVRGRHSPPRGRVAGPGVASRSLTLTLDPREVDDAAPLIAGHQMLLF